MLPEPITPNQAIPVLRLAANKIMAVDGDRDHMNQSNLKCEFTQSVARFMREVSDILERLKK